MIAFWLGHPSQIKFIPNTLLPQPRRWYQALRKSRILRYSMGRGTRWQGQCGISLQQYVSWFLKDLPMIELWMHCHSSSEWFKSNPTPLKFFMLNFFVMFFMGIDQIFQGNILVGDEKVPCLLFPPIYFFRLKKFRSRVPPIAVKNQESRKGR